MRNETLKLIYTLLTISEEEKKTLSEEIESIMGETMDTEICLYRLAVLAVDRSDFDTLKNHLNSLKTQKAQGQQTTLQKEEQFLKNNPNFLDSINEWENKLTKEEWDYLTSEILQNPEVPDKARTAARFLVKKSKI